MHQAEIELHREEPALLQKYTHLFRADRRVFPLIQREGYYQLLKTLYTIRCEQQVCGFLFQFRAHDVKAKNVENAILILPRFRRQGIATAALLAARRIRSFQDGFFRVAKTNTAALETFSRLDLVQPLPGDDTFEFFKY